MTLKKSDAPVASAGLIYGKMAAIMASLLAIGKERENPQQRYKFRGIDDAMNALHGPLSTHGVFYTAAVRDVRQREYATKSGTTMLHVMLTAAYTFHCEDGSSVTFEAVGEASDSGDKAAGKAQAYALKVALLQVFCIPTEEQKDTEYASPERAAPSQAPAPVVTDKPATDAQRNELRRVLDELDQAGKDAKRDSVRAMLLQFTSERIESALAYYKPQLAQLLDTGEVPAA